MELTEEVDPNAEPQATADDDESVAEATVIEPRSGPELEERAYEETLIDEDAQHETAPESQAAASASVETSPRAVSTGEADWNEPPEPEAADDTFSPFAESDDVATPRSRRPVVTLLIVALIVAALAAAFWFVAPPEWKARVGLGAGGTSPLALVTTHMDRQQLESGNELLTVSGRVINPTSSEQDVPPLQAQLRTKTGKVVYSWVIAPPAPSLAAGASAPFNSAEINVPPGGDELTISLGSPHA